jgi:hypothetical protein
MHYKTRSFENHLKHNYKNNKNILIFFQGFDNLAFILKILRKKNFDNCTIISTGAKKLVKKDITRLKKVNIYHISSKTNFLNILKLFYKFKVEKNFEKRDVVYDIAYYFSDCEDYVTSYYLSKLKIKKIYLLRLKTDKYNKIFHLKKEITFKNLIKISIIKFLIGDTLIKINLVKLFLNNRLLLKFIIKNQKIQSLTTKIDKDLLKLLPSYIRNKYNNNNKKIIFIDSLDYEKLSKDYLILIEKINNISKQLNFEFYYKPHYSKNFEIKNLDNKIKIINDKNPIHLFNFNKNCLICGLGSIALAHITKTNNNCKVISFIDIFKKKNQTKYFEKSKLYLLSHQSKKNKIIFLKNFDKFKTFLNLTYIN